MKRSTRMLLGISVALITAASLHLTVGERFHQRMSQHYGHSGCGHQWKQRYDHFKNDSVKPETPSSEGFQKF
ncbi:MAG: hypothetical protein ABIN80_15410 [Dyadobacter sp.]|uniref:hypothetical protein n=1 Tax=Dyadobacter sp. TaxID=1914288 RepID=UPI00326680BA